MDRTLFTPAMIETFRVCKKAYELAFCPAEGRKERVRLAIIVKRFLLRAFAEVNRGRLKSVHEAQRYIGQNWPGLRIRPESEPEHHQCVLAFRFAYRCLTAYASKPYRPVEAELVGVSLRLRARIPHVRVYLEDVLDMVLWHERERVLEIVDYHIRPLKQFDPSWPGPAILIKQFLAGKLRARFPFETFKLTFGHVQSQGVSYSSIIIDESLFNLHWPTLVGTLEEMKSLQEYPPSPGEICTRCEMAGKCPSALERGSQRGEGQVVA